jgi:hypothetical protein
MTKDEVILNFMKENGCILTFKIADERDPKLLRFVRGSYEYSVIYSMKKDMDLIAIFKKKTRAASRRPNASIPAVQGGPKQIKGHDTLRIKLSEPDSLEKIAKFL